MAVQSTWGIITRPKKHTMYMSWQGGYMYSDQEVFEALRTLYRKLQEDPDEGMKAMREKMMAAMHRADDS